MEKRGGQYTYIFSIFPGFLEGDLVSYNKRSRLTSGQKNQLKFKKKTVLYHLMLTYLEPSHRIVQLAQQAWLCIQENHVPF